MTRTVDKELKRILNYITAIEDRWKSKVRDRIVKEAEQKRTRRRARNRWLLQRGGFNGQTS